MSKLGHLLKTTITMAFCPTPSFLRQTAQIYNLSRRITSPVCSIHLNYVGVLTLELFVTEQGLYANEMACRVHNSGHWSIEGAICSQFENHIRAVAGLPLGSTDVVRPTVMINIIGQHPNRKMCWHSRCTSTSLQ